MFLNNKHYKLCKLFSEMLYKEEMPTRQQIEEKLTKVGDFVKIDFLTNCLKKNLDYDTRKFALVRLSGIYENKQLFPEAGKLMVSAADINTSFQGKISDFLKAGDLYIQGRKFLEAEASFNKAVSCANENQKVAIKIKKKESYWKQATVYMKKDQRKHALDIFERLLEIESDPLERKKINDNLLDLYKKLGKVREYSNLLKVMN